MKSIITPAKARRALKKIGVIIIATVVAASTFACKHTLDRNQLVGTWKIEEQSRVIEGAASADSTLILKADGEFTAVSIPTSFAPGLNSRSFLSGAGSWSIRDDDTGPFVLLVLKSVDGSKGESLPYGAQLFPDKSWSAIRLYYSRGDPDLFERVYFHRVSK